MTTPPEGSPPPGGSDNTPLEPTTAGSLARRLMRPAQIIIVSSVMFSFISYWRTAAVVLCDMSSTVYYIGAIVETAIGPAAPWFILAVLFFSFAMSTVYIESCALFVRGGVYRVVKETLGGFLAKFSVSALMFDYILTGPISGVSAGQYIVGLGLEAATRYGHLSLDADSRQTIKNWVSVLIACAITWYFYRQNLRGLSESSDKALKIMFATTLMGAIMLAWCGVTLVAKGTVNSVPSPAPDLSKKVEIDEAGKAVAPRISPVTGEQEDPFGFARHFPSVAEPLRNPPSWLSMLGAIGILIAFGHSILAMSGLETLAQVYREVESPKLPNFKKAAFIVFAYSLLLTGTLNFLSVLLIPDHQRMGEYYDNWIGGLAMHMYGPPLARLLLNAFVVVVGFLILSGAVNTSIIGSNGVLSRVAEDGVLPDWFLKPHRRYGTASRLLRLIVGLQLFTIIASRGDVIVLGEAYAFGVVWSFVLMTLSMVVLRFKDRTPRQFKVPINIRLGKVELPVGLFLIFLIVFFSALANLATKPLATVVGAAFTLAFLAVFVLTERYYERRRRGARYEHLEQFNRQTTEEATATGLSLTKNYRKLVAIRSPYNLFMLEKALAEADPETTSIVVMTAKLMPPGGAVGEQPDLDTYDQQLMTAVVQLAEKAGKQVKPLIVPTNNPLHAVLTTAKDIQAHEVIMGASNRYTADDQLDQIAFYWINLHGGEQAPLTVRILSRDRDIYLDLGGGNRIPKISERKARSVAELRAAGIGIDRVLLIHDGSPSSSDLFQGVLTMLDPEVVLGIVPVVPPGVEPLNGHGVLRQDEERAEQIGRALQMIQLAEPSGPAIVERARRDQYDLIIVPLSAEAPADPMGTLDVRSDYIIRHAHCRVFLAAVPVIPTEVVDQTPSGG